MANVRIRFRSINLDNFISPEKRKSLLRTILTIGITMTVTYWSTFYMVVTDIALFYVKWADAKGATQKSIIGAPIGMIYGYPNTDWLFRYTLRNTVCGYQDDCDASKITIQDSHIVEQNVIRWPNCSEWKPMWYYISRNGIVRADEFRR